MTEIIDAKETARLLGMSISYFYKIRSTAPDSLPPAVEMMGGRKVRPVWLLSIVIEWLELQTKRAEKVLSYQKQQINEEVNAKPKRGVGRPIKKVF